MVLFDTLNGLFWKGGSFGEYSNEFPWTVEVCLVIFDHKTMQNAINTSALFFLKLQVDSLLSSYESEFKQDCFKKISIVFNLNGKS